MTRVALEIQAILRDATGFVARHRLPVGLTLAVTAVATLLVMPVDARLLATVQQWSVAYGDLAEVVSRIGRFENSSLAFAVIAALIALVSRSLRWRDIAVACLLAGIVAGLTVNVLRPTFGRARPHANVEAGFYWFELEAQLHSMPSGHVMSNAASAWAIVPLAPVRHRAGGRLHRTHGLVADAAQPALPDRCALGLGARGAGGAGDRRGYSR